jgi:hypothetical protein
VYEPAIGNYTPDWLVNLNGQDVVAEVLRLNASSDDQKEIDFVDSIMNILGTIPVGCLVHFEHDDGFKDYSSINVELCRHKVSEWLQSPRNKGDVLFLYSVLNVSFEYYSDKYQHVQVIGGGAIIKFDYRRLKSSKSPLLVKAAKYCSLLGERNTPYLICMHLDFHTWFSLEDVYQTLYGLRCSDYGIGDIPTLSSFIEEALYYIPERPMRDVSGILIKYNDQFVYYHNYADTRLTPINKQLLLQYQHPHK